MDIKKLVDEEVVDELERLRGMAVGSDEYKATLPEFTKLLDRSIEMEKLDREHKLKEETQKFENDLKIKQMKEDRIDRLVKNIMTGVSIGGTLLLTIWGTNKTLRFEEEGTITTTAGRKFTGKLFSWLK